MNPMGLMELAQIREQEYMREALRRAALREARKEAGVTWLQLVRARFFPRRNRVTAPVVAAAEPAAQSVPAVSSAPMAHAAAPISLAAPTVSTPAPRTVTVSVTAERTASRPVAVAAAPHLRVIRAAEPEPECVGVDC